MESGVVDVHAPVLAEIAAGILHPDPVSLLPVETEHPDLEIDRIEIAVFHRVVVPDRILACELQQQSRTAEPCRISRAARQKAPPQACAPDIQVAPHLRLEGFDGGTARVRQIHLEARIVLAPERRLKLPDALGESRERVLVPILIKAGHDDLGPVRAIAGVRSLPSLLPNLDGCIRQGSGPRRGRPFDLGAELDVGSLSGSRADRQSRSEELYGQTADPLAARRRSIQSRPFDALLVGRADPHPEAAELPGGHAVPVIGYDDLVGAERDGHAPGVGVVCVLHELGECDVRLADEALAEFPQQGGIGREGEAMGGHGPACSGLCSVGIR